MARRTTETMRGERFCGDRRSMQVHDLDNEKSACKIDEIISSKSDVGFDFLASAESNGYSDCTSCLGTTKLPASFRRAHRS